MKRQRILEVNDVNEIPGSVVCVEVATHETVDEINPKRQVHTLRCGHAIAGRLENGKWTRERQKYFTAAPEFWSWLDFARQAGHPVWLFGCSIGKSVTLLGLWNLLTSGEFVLNRPGHPNIVKAKSAQVIRSMSRTSKGLLVTTGPVTAIICYNKNRWKLTIVSLQNYADHPPEKMADLVGIPFSPIPGTTDPDGAWSDHVEARCNVTRECVRRLIEWHSRQELGRFSLTISGVAMSSFRHRFMRDKIVLPDEQDDRDWERDGYLGGHVEPFWAGKIHGGRYYPPEHCDPPRSLFEDQPTGPFHVVDSRSFYGAIQTYEEVPVECVESHLAPDSSPPDRNESIVEVMASVEITSHDATYPVRTSAGTLFATGCFITTLCGPELLRAVFAGHVTQFYGWRRYRLAQALRWFSEGFWQQRIESESRDDRYTASLCKSIIARMHGKFSQRATRWSFIPNRVPPGPWEHWTQLDCATKTVRKFRSVGWDVQIEDDAGDAPHCFPAIAAWVTSHGREYLRHWCQVAGPRHVLYVSTDALIVDDTGKSNLEQSGLIYPEGVGSLRVVYSSPDIEIRGPNNYTIGEKSVVSGRPLNNLSVNGSRWNATRWQGVEEVFLSTCKSQITAYEMTGIVSNYTASGRVGPGGWIEPPVLTKVSQELCHQATQ